MSGVIRNWRVHPAERSTAIRAPLEMTAIIVPTAAIPAMKYSGKATPSNVACRWGEVTTKYRTTG